MTAYEMVGAFLMVSLVLPFAISGGYRFWPFQWDWLWLILLSLLCTVWAFFLQLKALHHISAFTLNLSYNLEPVYGIVLAFVIFQENRHLNSAFYAGVGFIIMALVLQMYAVKRNRRVEVPA